MRFRDRIAAGQELAHALRDLQERRDLLVLGIPRGGVVVAAEIARALSIAKTVSVRSFSIAARDQSGGA